MTLAAFLVAWSAPVLATWSIVATDARTSEVGGAITSCVGSMDLSIVLGVAPGAGAIHAQCWVNTDGRDTGVEMLAAGSSPEEVIAAITDAAFDPDASVRQYGVVDLQGRAAGWTGTANDTWAGDIQGADGRYTWSAQGNILTGESVVSGTNSAFETGEGCDLADQLIRALEAGAADGGGDNRCAGGGIPSDSAHLRVVDASGLDVVALSVVDTAPISGVRRLRFVYDAWRAEHPCPESDDTAPADTGPANTDSEEGCDCATGRVNGAGAVLLASLLALLCRRRSYGSAIAARGPTSMSG